MIQVDVSANCFSEWVGKKATTNQWCWHEKIHEVGIHSTSAHLGPGGVEELCEHLTDVRTGWNRGMGHLWFFSRKKTDMAGWKSSIFNRRYIHLHSWLGFLYWSLVNLPCRNRKIPHFSRLNMLNMLKHQSKWWNLLASYVSSPTCFLTAVMSCVKSNLSQWCLPCLVAHWGCWSSMKLPYQNIPWGCKSTFK